MRFRPGLTRRRSAQALLSTLLSIALMIPLSSLALAGELTLIWKPPVEGRLKPDVGVSIARNAFVPMDQADVVMQDKLLVATNGARILRVNQDFGTLRKVPTDGYSDEANIALPDGVYVIRNRAGQYAKLCLCGTYFMGMAGQPTYTEIGATLAVAAFTSAPAGPEPVNPAAQPGSGRVVRLQVDNPAAEVDGRTVPLDVPPQLIANRTMVPLRFVAEALGAAVKWNGDEKKITLTTGNRTIALWVDRRAALIDSVETALDVPPTIVANRTLVPLRFVGENLGATLAWNPADRSIALTAAGAAPPAASKPQGTDLSFFFRTWQMAVPGAVVETPIWGTNYSTVRATPGALSGGLTVNSDGTYVWNSTWEGRVINGTWKETGNSGYPILLLAGEDKKDWKLGKWTSPNQIVIWDGSSIYKVGKPVE